MKRVLRSIIDINNTITPANLAGNFQYLLSSRLEWTRDDDRRIFDFIKSYFHQRIDLPSKQTIADYFEASKDVDVVERLKDIEASEIYIRTNFVHLVKSLVDLQNKAKFLALTKEAQDIATKGLVIEKERIQGLGPAISHLVSNAHALIVPDHGSRIRGDIRDDAEEVRRDYELAEANRALAWGKFCGLNEIDSVIRGIRKGELWVHAAFVGELKTTFACTWAYNLVTRYRTNVAYVTLEMPYEQVRLMIYVMHSSNAKWKLMGYKPLCYDRVKDGLLTPEEKAFYELVIEDFSTNPDYGSFFVWSPIEDATIDDIQLEAELKHKQTELGLIVIDHGGLVEARKKKRNKDYTVELNSVIRDAKRLALHFNDGERVPVLLLFQINREGKEYADKNEGRYKLKALSYANECERSADVVTTTYLNDEHRAHGTTLFDNLKRRDGTPFKPFTATVIWDSKRIVNQNVYSGSQGNGISIEDRRTNIDMLNNV